MSKILDQLKRHIDTLSILRGQTYALSGRVKSWSLSADGEILTAVVRGRSTYEQVTRLIWSATGMLSDIHGNCSCPVAHNCKHVAAAILAAEASGTLTDPTYRAVTWGSPRVQAQPATKRSGAASSVMRSTTAASVQAPPPALDPQLRRWLDQYQSQSSGATADPRSGTDPNQYSSTVKDRIRYVIGIDRGRVTILPTKVSVRKDGRLGASTPSPYDFRNFNHDNPPRFILPVDLRIFRLMSLSPRDWTGRACMVSDDDEGQTLFRVVLESGRAHWGDVYDEPLHLGEPRSGQFAWRDLGEIQQLMVKADGAEDEDLTDNTQSLSSEQWLTPLPLMPAWYLDMATGSCGILQTDVSPQQARWLASAPPVPASQADEMLAAMSQARIAAPRPRSVARQWITSVEPVPMLTLGTIKARPPTDGFFRYYTMPFQDDEIAPMLRPAFVYDGRQVLADDPDPAIRRVVDGALEIIERKFDSEAALMATLVECANSCGFHPSDHYANQADFSDARAQDLILWPFNSDNPMAPGGGARQALDFVEDVVPDLKKQGWQVVIDPTWPCQVSDQVPRFSGGVQQHDGTWFSVGLNYEVDGQEFDLLPVLADLLESLSEDLLENEQALLATLAGKRFVARLKDGRYARLPIEPLIPALRFVRDLNQHMHAAQASMIHDLAQALEGCNIPFSCGPEILALGTRLRDLAICHTQTAELPQPPAHFKGSLRPYQKAGMAWMQALCDTGFGGILADDMGLGKTVQTLAFLASRRPELAKRHLAPPSPTTRGRRTAPPPNQQLPCLLVVPTSLVSNWAREAARFVPGLSVLTLHGTGRKRYLKEMAQYDLIITTYPLLIRDCDALFAQNYDVVILDEAQNVKNPASQVAKLVRQIPGKHRLALTGTPMENNLEELWCLFDWLIPGLLGNRKSFGEQFRKPIEKEGNAERQAVLSKRISPFILRRTKDQVVTDLPPRTEIVESVQLTGSQRALYETVRSTMHERVRKALSEKGLASSQITVLDALLKLRQACCDPQLVKLASAASITTSAKRTRLMELLESLIAEGRQVLVFSQFVEMLKLIEADVKANGWRYLMLTGQTQKRGELVEAFQSGKASVFLISLKAGGVGLNLTAADTVILYDPWWNPAIERQAMDRVHRIGQDKPVFVHRLIAESTVETRIAEMQARKQALMDAVLDPDATNSLQMSEEEILSLFAPTAY